MSEIPRRARMDQWTPAEKAIYEAVGTVEGMGADVRLTDAVTLLGSARDRVADFVDGVPGIRVLARQTYLQDSFAHSAQYLRETAHIADQLGQQIEQIECLASNLSLLRDNGGRLFIVGLGGSAANASHAAADFRKLAGMQAECLSDSAAELTARANDEGWPQIYADALAARRAGLGDALLVLSVGGGTEQVSLPLVKAIDHANAQGMKVLGIVGRDGGYTARNADAVVIVPTVNDKSVTPHTEAFQGVLLHLLVSHPVLQQRATKW